MFVQQYFVKGIAHSSYLLGGAKTCAIVDPRRDIQIYLDEARAMGMKITHILETHLHADFVSGHLDLAQKTGAKIYAPRAAQCKFPHVSLSEGDSFYIEDIELKVLVTPGHTPEHISYVLIDHARGPQPAGVFCGDTLFVGDVGRPDLFPGRAQELADILYDSLHRKLMQLPDFCEVYPAHGAGSLCGRAMGAKRTSTIGYEKQYNSVLQIKDRESFIRSLTTDMPAAPDHFSRLSAVNGAGPALTVSLPAPEALEPDRFQQIVTEKKAIVLDIRSYDAFGGQHVPGCYHIDFSGNFATFAGWILPGDHEILLVPANAGAAEQTQEAVFWLRRVGLDRVIGYLDGGMFEWARAGLPTNHVSQLSTQELHTIAGRTQKIALIDVRAPSEYEKFHIQGAVNISVQELRTRYAELDPKLRTVLICRTGHRSSLGSSILKQKGFTDVWNAAGGMTAYTAAGYGPECPVCVIPHGPHFLGRAQ